MSSRPTISHHSMLFVLHPVFALTGVADVITGPMLPSLAPAFHLSDSQSGLFLFSTFAGMSTGALLCRSDYARALMVGLFALTVSCLCFPFIPRPILYPFAFCFGVSIGLPMTATSLFVGRNYPARRASTLTLLNLAWSVGAMLAPLLAAQVLGAASWHVVYFIMAASSGLAFIVVAFTIRDSAEAPRIAPEVSGLRNLRFVALFAIFFFLEVGMESMFGAWLSTYMLRVTQTTVTLAASATAIYWTGFLISRALSPVLLLRTPPGRLLQIALPTAVVAAVLLLASRSPWLLITAILLLGAALAPIFPVALAIFFDRGRHSSDSRYLLAFSGFGGSTLLWLVGSIASHTGSLRTGLLVGPTVLLVMTAMLFSLRVSQPGPTASAAPFDGGRHVA